MSAPYKLFYASDIHGSEKCFLKFINAGKFYRANALVLGGDVTGKMVVPLIDKGGRWEARFLGRDFVAENAAERAEIEKNVRMNGFYPVVLIPSCGSVDSNVNRTGSAGRDSLLPWGGDWR